MSAYAREPPTEGERPGLILPAFGEIESERVLAEDDLFAVVCDKYPVTPGHTLIIARRAATRFEQLTDAEQARLLSWVGWAQRKLGSTLSPSPEGYNLGVNDGTAAGQTIPQFHFHVIPRYRGDVSNPRGGLCWVIPAKVRY